MKRIVGQWLLFAAALTLCASTAWAIFGFTSVTATVKDPTGRVYAGCQATVDFIPPTGATTQPLLSGSTFQTSYPAVQCDSFGKFSITLPDNLVIFPSGPPSSTTSSQWRFSVCSQDKKTCFSCSIVITGASMDITTQLQTCAASLPAASVGLLLQTNGTNNASQTTMNLLNSAPTNGITLTHTNTSLGNVQLGLSGILTVPGGGIGLGTLTAHSLYVGNGTASPNPVAPGNAGQVLISNGPSADPTFQDPVVTPKTACGTTVFNIPMQAVPTTLTVVASVSTCLIAVNFSNTTSGVITVVLEDNQASPVVNLNSFTLNPGGQIIQPLYGIQFLSGVRWSASATGVSGAIFGFQ